MGILCGGVYYITLATLLLCLVGCGEIDKLDRRTNRPATVTQVQAKARGLEVAVGFLPPGPDGLRPLPPSLRSYPLIPKEVRPQIGPNQQFADGHNDLGLQTVDWQLDGDSFSSTSAETTYPAGQPLDVFFHDGYVSRIKRVDTGTGGGSWTFVWHRGTSAVPDTTITFRLTENRRQVFVLNQLVYESPAPLDPHAMLTLRTAMLLKGQAGQIGDEAEYLGAWTITDDVVDNAPIEANFRLRELAIENYQLTVNQNQATALVTADVVLKPDSLPPPTYPRSLDHIFYELDVIGSAGSLVKALPGAAGPGPEGSLQVEWDGIDRFGQQKNPLLYAYRLRVGLGSSTASPSGYFTIVSDSVSKVVMTGQELPERVVSEVDLYPPGWMPGYVDDEGYPIDLEINSFINTPSQSHDIVEWKIRILDPEGQVLVEELAAGNDNYVYASWDGVDDEGNLVNVPAESLVFQVTGHYCLLVDQPNPTLVVPHLNGVGIAGYFRADPSSSDAAIYLRNANGEEILAAEVPAQVCQLFDSNDNSTTPGVIEVFRGATALLNSTQDGRVALGFNGPRQGQDPRTSKNYDDEPKQRAFLKRVYRQDVEPTLRVEVGELQFEEGVDPPAKLVVELEGDLSKRPITKELTRGADGVYSGTITINDQLVTGTLVTHPDEPNEASKPVRTKYCTGFRYHDRFVGLGVTEAIVDLMSTPAETGDPYAAAQKLLGSFGEAGWFENFDVDLDEVTSTPENVRSLGFEAVRFRVRPELNPTLVSDVEAILKVRNPADVAILNFHGTHSGTLLVSQEAHNEGAKLNPPLSIPYVGLTPDPTLVNNANTQITRNDVQHLRTLMLIACSGLDAYDFNNWQSSMRGGTWPPLSQRTFGGIAWNNITHATTGGTVMLGYAAPAPIDAPSVPGVAEVVRRYGDTLNELEDSDNPRVKQLIQEGHLEAVAWVLANYRLGIQAPAPPPPHDPPPAAHRQAFLLQACAWDAGYYYYIPFEYTKTTWRGEDNRIDLKSADGVYRVPISALAEPVTSWEQNRRRGLRIEF